MLATFFAKYTCRKRQTYQNEAKNLCSLLFVFDLDSECIFIKNKIVRLLKKYVLGCHFSVYIISYSSNQGGSQEHISLIA